MSASPRVTILLPVRDGARFLDHAIQSIRDQHFTDFELVAIDDGSGDATPAILARHAAADPRIRVVTQEPGGIVAALTRGLDLARGELIARMDADDVAVPHRLSSQAGFLDRNADVALVGSAILEIDGAGNPCGAIRHPGRHDAIVAALWRGDNVIAHPSVMMRRAAIVALGGYRAPFRHAEDFDLWLRMAERFRLANLREPLLHYRRHVDSVGARHREAQIAGGWAAIATARLTREGRGLPLREAGFGFADLAHIAFSSEERRGLLLVLAELAIEVVDGAGHEDALRRFAAAVLPEQAEFAPDALAGAAIDAAAMDAGRNRRIAHRMMALARLAAAGKDGRAALRWSARACATHPLGPVGVAGLALGRVLRQRNVS